MLGRPRNNFTYLGPSDIGIWAHYVEWFWFGKTSGFTKPVTSRTWENPKGRSFWGILGFFSRKSFSQYPNTLHIWLGIHDNAKNFDSTQENVREAVLKEFFFKKQKPQKLHQGHACKEIVSLVNPFQKIFVTVRKMRWRRGTKDSWPCMLYK